MVVLHKYELLEIIGRYRHCFSMSCYMRSRFEKFHHIFNSKYKSLSLSLAPQLFLSRQVHKTLPQLFQLS